MQAVGHGGGKGEWQERIIFDPGRYPKQKDAAAALERFLVEYPPSRTSNQRAAWVQVHARGHLKAKMNVEQDVEGAVSEWRRLVQSGKEALSVETTSRLAKKYNVLVGKWLLFPPPAAVDSLWAMIARGTVEGSLGSCSAKVSTVPNNSNSNNNEEDSNKNFVMCVYTHDFTDHAHVLQVRQALHEILQDLCAAAGCEKKRGRATCAHKAKLPYKPDIHTYLNIYKNNAWGIPPALFYR
ncbi:hypothetical protein QOT17_002074 [Balamuthia mandrillaris]